MSEMVEGTSDTRNAGSGSTREARRALRNIIEECLEKAKDGDFSNDEQEKCLEKARELQLNLDLLVDEAFANRTAALAELSEELRQINEDIKKKNSEINAKNEKLKKAADFLGLFDRALGVLKKFI